MKKIYFLSGLPRTGSTLLASILNQNPDIHVSPNSPVCQIMWTAQQAIFGSEQFKAYPKPQEGIGILSGIMPAYYSENTERIIIDKCRTWGLPANVNMIQNFITPNVRIVCTVRPVVEMLASFISLIHKNPPGSIFDENLGFHYRSIDDARCDKLMMPGGEIDRAMASIMNLVQNRHMAHFVEYDDLVDKPEETTRSVYDFLEIQPFAHDFQNIVNPFPENDSVYGLEGMHTIRPGIGKTSQKPEEVLSEYIIRKYSGIEFWN